VDVWIRAVEDLVRLRSALGRGASVLVTGHTGFKGSWLSLWLAQLGARVHGVAMDPPGDLSLFALARIAPLLASDIRADIRDPATLERVMRTAEPSVVFHLAAQPLVRQSYEDPIGTFATNVMGTLNLLDSVRRTPSVQVVVIVTTDKVYENHEWDYPYRELDRLGGRDPYSASKATCEIAVSSMRASFFGGSGHSALVATARAGNVIGGGDFARDRLVPDCLRAFAAQQPVVLRYPGAVRPWQHVLEPLSGYLHLVDRLLSPGGQRFARAYNFGPDIAGDADVNAIAGKLARLWGQGATVECRLDKENPHEAGVLRLDSTFARLDLRWAPRLSLDQALEWTVGWERARLAGADMRRASEAQIEAYARRPR
jgi:CDP-glucose 4,6-dehydratase